MGRIYNGVAAVLASAVLAMVLMAMVMPVFAYSGPGMGTYRVAGCAQQAFRASGKWPETITLEDRCLRRRPKYELYNLSVVRLRESAESAFYRIRLNDKDEIWRVTRLERPAKVHSEG